MTHLDPGADSRGLYILGAGWFAVEVAGWAEEAGWDVLGLVELIDPSRVGIEHQGYRVVSADVLSESTPAIVAGGGDRREIWELARLRAASAPIVVHPTAHVSASAKLASGVIVAPLAVIGARSSVHEHCLLSRGTLVGHHVTIGSFTHLMPGANVAGHAKIGDDVTVGMAAAIVDHASVGDGATVAAGAVVVRDVAPASRVQGVPARVYEQ
jgi:sugar O-acyltransferase (sialic acid O-acetyltransferase NeuD family)